MKRLTEFLKDVLIVLNQPGVIVGIILVSAALLNKVLAGGVDISFLQQLPNLFYLNPLD